MKKIILTITYLLSASIYAQEGYQYLNVLLGADNKKYLAYHVGWLHATERYNGFEIFFESNIPHKEKPFDPDFKNSRYFGGLSYHKNILRSKNLFFTSFIAMKAGGKEKDFAWGPSAGLELGIFIWKNHMLSISNRNDYLISDQQFYPYLLIGYKIPL